MNSHFAQSGLVFPQFWVFEAIFKVHGQNSQHLFCSICTFYCTQNDRPDLTVSTQKSVWKMTHRGLRYLRKTFSTRGLVWCAVLEYIFANISAQSGSFSKPIFALKPWDRDGRFEYNKRYKRSKDFENFVHLAQIMPQKPKIAGKLELIGKKGFSFSYMWLLNW